MRKIFYMIMVSLFFSAGKAAAQGFNVIPKMGLNL